MAKSSKCLHFFTAMANYPAQLILNRGLRFFEPAFFARVKVKKKCREKSLILAIQGVGCPYYCRLVST